MKIKSVIFDWDGTIAMTLHLWFAGYKESLKNLGFEFSDKIIVGDFFYEHDKAALKYPDIDFDNLIVNARDYITTHMDSLETYPNAREALQKMKDRGIVLTLVSSSSRKLLKEGLEKTGLEDIFNAIVSGDDVMRHKPDPEPFDQVVEIAKLNKEETIIIGDSHNDIIAAKAAGITSALFLPEENSIFYDFEKLKSENPEHNFTSLDDFAEMVINDLS